MAMEGPLGNTNSALLPHKGKDGVQLSSKGQDRKKALPEYQCGRGCYMDLAFFVECILKTSIEGLHSVCCRISLPYLVLLWFGTKKDGEM